ncbi:MAG: FadR/GntR family transcriptional regulator [Chloroflexota bacterium]
MKAPLRGPALYTSIRDYIKEYILEHNLKPGDALPPEGQLVEELGVGRSSVREAVKSLQSMGIVDVRQGDGLYVRELNFDPMLETFLFGMQFNPHTLAELLQIRIWLEVAVIGDAVEHIGADEVAKLEDLLKTWEARVQDGEEYSDLDESFHQIVYGVLQNDTLMKFFSVFWVTFTSLESELTRDTDPENVLEFHKRILEAIQSRDPSQARTQLLQHFDHVKERIDHYIVTTSG